MRVLRLMLCSHIRVALTKSILARFTRQQAYKLRTGWSRIVHRSHAFPSRPVLLTSSDNLGIQHHNLAVHSASGLPWSNWHISSPKSSDACGLPHFPSSSTVAHYLILPNTPLRRQLSTSGLRLGAPVEDIVANMVSVGVGGGRRRSIWWWLGWVCTVEIW